MKSYEGPIVPYYVKGFTVKCGSLRYKWINPYFDEVKNLKINKIIRHIKVLTYEHP